MKEILTLVLAAVIGGGAVAADTKPTTAKTDKKVENRAKKQTICESCGKPESKCDCHDEKSSKDHDHDHDHKDGKGH